MFESFFVNYCYCNDKGLKDPKVSKVLKDSKDINDPKVLKDFDRY